MRIAKLICILFVMFLYSCGNSGSEDRIPDLDDVDDILTPQLNVLNEAIEDDPENPVYYFKRSKVYSDLRNYPLALTDISKAIKLDNTEGKFYFHLAQTNNHLGKYTESLAAAHRAEELKVTDPELYILMADLYWEKNDRANSDIYISKAEAIAPHHADVYVTRGKIIGAKGDTLNAMKNFYMALGKDKKNIEAYKELVKVFHAQHKRDSAMVFIKKGMHLSRTEPLFHFYEGKLFEDLNLTNSSRIAYETALSNDSSYYPASYELGMVSYKNNDLGRALNHFLNVTRYQSNMVSANLYVAELYEKFNKGVLAIPFYERVLASDSGNARAKVSLKELYIRYPDKKAKVKADTILYIPVIKDTLPVIKTDTAGQNKPKPVVKPKKPKKDTTYINREQVNVTPPVDPAPQPEPKVETPGENNVNTTPPPVIPPDPYEIVEKNKKKKKKKDKE